MEYTHPQERALNIGKNACLVMSYIYSVGIEPDTMGYIKIVSDALDVGLEVSGISGDCTVENPERFLEWLTGKRYQVLKKVCLNIKNIKERTPVNYVYTSNGKKINHFVVVENGEIVFNPLAVSNCVNYGAPESARVITLRK